MLALTVLDMRAEKAFGARGGIYATALITPRTEVEQTLRRVIAERLQNGNFQLVDSSQADTTTLTLDVRIKRINYSVTERVAGGLLNDVKVHALFEATARNAERLLSGQYQATATRQFNGYPSAAQNEILLNEVVGKALQGILSDRELLAVLQN